MRRNMLTTKQLWQLIYACQMGQSYLPHPNTTFLALMQLVKGHSECFSPDLDSFSIGLQCFKAKYYPYGFKPNTKWIREHLPEIYKAAQRLLPKNVMGMFIYTKEATELDTVAFLWIMRGCKRYLSDGLSAEAEKNLFECALRMKALCSKNF